jgi:hypothetical protein
LLSLIGNKIGEIAPEHNVFVGGVFWVFFPKEVGLLVGWEKSYKYY